MAVTAETRTQLIGLSVVMLGSAPGTMRLGDWVKAIDDGMSLTDIANMIEDSAEFREAYPSFLTDDDFAAEFLTNLGGDTIDGALLAAVVDIIVELLAEVEDGGGGLGRGEVMLLATQAMLDISAQGDSHPAYGDLGAAADALANKVAVATHYTIAARMEMPSMDVLMGVTDDPDTVAMAIDMIDNPPAPPPMGEEFTLTPSINRFTGGDGDDLFIAHPSAAGTDTLSRLDKLDGGAGMDTLDLASTDPDGFMVSSTIRVSNIENLVVNTEGAFRADLSSWTGLENIDLGIIGFDEIDDVALDLNAAGAALTAGWLDGVIEIENASMVDLMRVGSNSVVNIGTGTHTASVAVNGGKSVSIAAGIAASGFAEGASTTLSSVSLTETSLTATINSDALTELNLTDIDLTADSGTISVDNNATDAGALTVNVDGFAASLNLNGTKAAETLNLISADESNNSLMLTGTMAVGMINVSGSGMLTFNAAAGNMVKSLTVSEMAGLTFDGANFGMLETADASGTMGNVTLTGLGSTVESVMTGGGDDMVALAEGHTGEVSIDLGAGDDSFTTTSAGNAASGINGGAGTDVLKMPFASHSRVDADGNSIYSGFEILDIGVAERKESDTEEPSGGGTYNMEVLHAAGIRGIYVSGQAGNGIVVVEAQNVRAGTEVTVFGTPGAARTRAVHLTYSLADASGDNDSVTLNLMSIGGANDVAADVSNSDSGSVVRLQITAPDIEHAVVNIDADNSANDGKVPTTAYRSLLDFEQVSDLKSIEVNGNARALIEVIPDVESSLEYVDIRGLDGGANFAVSEDHAIAVTFRGSPAGDAFGGGSKADVIIGGGGNDFLNGRGGDDAITGGGGADTLDGGAGADTYRYASASDSQVMFDADTGAASGYDTVTLAAEDRIGLRNVGVGLNDLREFLDKGNLADHSDGDSNANNQLMTFLGDGEDFFVRGTSDPDDPDNSDLFAIALLQNGTSGTFLFLDANGNGDFDVEADMVMLLNGTVTTDHFILL